MSYRFSGWQQLADGAGWPWWLGWVPRWRVPASEPVADRMLDTRRASVTEEVQWPIELASVRVQARPPAVTWQGSLGGIPVQRVAPDNRKWAAVAVINPWLGNEVSHARIPVPVSGEWWVEGYPAMDGAFDRHLLLVCPETREAWECIGFFPDAPVTGTRAMAVAHYSPVGLDTGVPTYAAGASTGVPESALLLRRGDPLHRLALALNDYVGVDGTKTPASGWPRCGDVLRLKPTVAVQLAEASLKAGAPLTAEERAYLTMWTEHGAVVHDRTGASGPSATVGWVPGSEWASSDLPRGRVDFPFSALERVVASY